MRMCHLESPSPRPIRCWINPTIVNPYISSPVRPDDNCAISVCPQFDANWKGVLPRTFKACGSASRVIKISTVPKCRQVQRGLSIVDRRSIVPSIPSLSTRSHTISSALRSQKPPAELSDKFVPVSWHRSPKEGQK
jgi:hypothetical protein